MKNQACRTKHSQSGSVLFIIFIAIALFAALSYVMMQSSNSSGSVGAEKGKLSAIEIMQYGQKIEQAIKTMIISGCSATQISFERAPFNGTDADYTNPNSPSNFSCHVFHPKGGAVAVLTPDINFLNNTSSVPSIFRNRYVFSGESCISGVGSGGLSDVCWNNGTNNDTELTMYLTDVKEEVCTQVNNLAQISTKPIMANANGNMYDSFNQTYAFFKGSFGDGGMSSGHIHLATGMTNNVRFLCFFDQTPNANVVYYVVLAR